MVRSSRSSTNRAEGMQLKMAWYFLRERSSSSSRNLLSVMSRLISITEVTGRLVGHGRGADVEIAGRAVLVQGDFLGGMGETVLEGADDRTVGTGGGAALVDLVAVCAGVAWNSSAKT
jgi:hypothetical protein